MAKSRFGRRSGAWGLPAAALLWAVVGCGTAQHAPLEAAQPVEAAPSVEAAPGGVLDARIDTGALSLHIHCEGTGAPAVVFDSGLGLDGSGWFGSEAQVGLAAARLTRACAYDRAGRGQSDPPTALPHSNRQMARELFALLEKAGERGPFVLVGHSMGGTNVQLFLAEIGRAHV